MPEQREKTQPITGEVAPAAMRIYIRVLMNKIMGGEEQVFTEKDFTEEELDVLRQLQATKQEQIESGNVPTFVSDRQITYSDYQPLLKDKTPILNEGSLMELIGMILDDPVRSMAFTLGKFGVEPGRAYDQYDFLYSDPARARTRFFQGEGRRGFNTDPVRSPELLGAGFGLGPGTGPRIEIDLARPNE